MKHMDVSSAIIMNILTGIDNLMWTTLFGFGIMIWRFISCSKILTNIVINVLFTVSTVRGTLITDRHEADPVFQTFCADYRWDYTMNL